MAKLKRTLHLTEVTFFAAGVILGAGIYTIVGKAAGYGGNMLWLSFLVASVTAIMTAFAYAELVALFPEAGGEFSYVKHAAGKKAAFIVGPMVALSGILSAATISIAFAGYLIQLLPFNPTLSALGIIGFILLINISGIKQSSIFNIIFTSIETAGLLLIVYAAWPTIGKINYLELPPEGIHGILVAASLSFFAFIGFEDAVKLAEETKQPEKNMPKALLIASGIVVLVYMIVVIAAVSAVPFSTLAQSSSPLADIAETRFGKMGITILATIALFSTSNSLLSNMLGASRVIYQMGKESKLLKPFSFVSEKKKTPVMALILASCIIGAFSLIGKIETVAMIGNFFVFGVFILIHLTVIHLRIKDKSRERPFKIPGNIKNIPVMSILAILMILVLTGYTIYGLTL